jgi:hypothetical protein
VPILVKCITLKLLIYYFTTHRLTQTKIYGGLTPPKKGKEGDILIIFMKSVIYGYIIYPKFRRDGKQVTKWLK